MEVISRYSFNIPEQLEFVYHLLTLYSLQGLNHFDEILEEADGIILSRGNFGIDLPPEKVGYLNLRNALSLNVSS